MENLELFLPLRSAIITQPFGVNKEYYQANGINIEGHNGIDLYALDSIPIYSATAGVVTASAIDRFFGEYIEITTEEEYNFQHHGNKRGRAKTVYVHFKKGSRVPKAGDKVEVGAMLGLADNTGLSTGTHLHFGLKRVTQTDDPLSPITQDQTNGYIGAIDPLPYLSKFPAQGANGIKANLEKQVVILKQVVELLIQWKITKAE